MKERLQKLIARSGLCSRRAAEEHGRVFSPYGEHLAREQLDERGLAGAVRAQQRDVLAFAELEVVDVQDGARPADDLSVVDAEQRLRGLVLAQGKPPQSVRLNEQNCTPARPYRKEYRPMRAMHAPPRPTAATSVL